MKKIKIFRNLGFAATLIACNISFAQTTQDTVKTDKSNDPMVVDPGNTSDSMTVKPGKTNDAIAAFTDTGFISKNIVDNMAEITFAKSGLNKGKSSQVKKVATLMISDHTAILNDLKKLAAKKGISETDQHDMSSMPSMNTATGSDFDKTWASEMLTMHEAKIAELENYINLSSDEEIKAAAGKALQKIRVHRNMLMKIAGAKSKMGVA